jgi:hypothetical protein
MIDAESRKRMAAGRRRWDLLNTFADKSANLVSLAAVAVWFIIFRHARPTGHARISQKRIADSLGTATRYVRHRIRELADEGLLVIESTGRQDRTPAFYIVKARPSPTAGDDATGDSAGPSRPLKIA